MSDARIQEPDDAEALRNSSNSGTRAAMRYADSLRARRLVAYRAGAYTFSAPPVCCERWTAEDWCNYVTFNDPELTGYLPRATLGPTKQACKNCAK